ncbi:MAG: myo-inositol-1-phosphate synthase, partial [Gemmatimonadetes bacterium]|nr:myo-inositol-1-phosphate synthase [Gemmatimonadota bacterium]
PDVTRLPRTENLSDFVRDHPDLPPSLVFTCAAIEAGCALVNFTPSLALDVPTIAARAVARGLPYCGRDGKTGETLLKSVLAPMFLARNLRVLGWESHNLLGNRDGAVLDHEANRRSKLSGKSEVVEEILDYPLHHRVRIDTMPSLDDWKTAWNLIHFEGFLGTRMSLQFTWQGCDSALAAPLVLDLVRLAEFAHRQGEAGPLRHTAAFFKSTLGGAPAAFPDQMELLRAYARSHATRDA